MNINNSLPLKCIWVEPGGSRSISATSRMKGLHVTSCLKGGRKSQTQAARGGGGSQELDDDVDSCIGQMKDNCVKKPY